MKIKLADSVGTVCSSIDDGMKLHKIIFPELQNGRSVELNFQGVQSILTPFLHSSIGKLLEIFGKEAVMGKLVLCNISQEHLKKVNQYIDQTDQQQMQSDSRETLMELFEEDELSDSGM